MNPLTRYTFPELSTWGAPARLSSFRDELDRLFEFAFPNGRRDAGMMGGWAPPLDLAQDKESLTVRVELPGMKKEEIELALHENTLSISGERKREEEAQEGETYRSERYFGRFARSITLPTPVDAAKVKATYQDGILTVLLPKAEEAKPKQIEVSVA
jgi:HSP20 family protein